MKVYQRLSKDKKEQLIKNLIDRFSGLVNGTITGFDRIVFKGFILPLMSASEVMRFCSARNILNKNYKEWMMTQTKRIVNAANNYSKDVSLPYPDWPQWP